MRTKDTVIVRIDRDFYELMKRDWHEINMRMKKTKKISFPDFTRSIAPKLWGKTVVFNGKFGFEGGGFSLNPFKK